MEGKPSDKPPGEKPDGGRKNALVKLGAAFAIAAAFSLLVFFVWLGKRVGPIGGLTEKR